MQNSYLFIVNPNSNSGKTFKKWNEIFLPKIQTTFPQHAWALTNTMGDAAFIANYAKKLCFDAIVAVGGDGTINEVVNGLLDKTLNENHQHTPKIEGFIPKEKYTSPNSNCMPALGFIPNGTGCDFIKSIHIPNNFEESLKILIRGNRQQCDVGKVQFTIHKQNPFSEFRYFINVASFGVSGEVVKQVNKSKKVLGSSMSFWLSSIQALLKNKPHEVSIRYDDNPAVKLNIQVLFAGNGQYCGGGMRVSKDASLNDGLFHITEIQKINRAKSILLTHRLYSGDFSGLESFIRVKTAKKIRVESEQNSDILIECDGEQPGILPAEFSITDKKIGIIC